ncbi:MAG: molybdopterin molybdotransferase MoeA [Thermoguttaceae bacterium]
MKNSAPSATGAPPAMVSAEDALRLVLETAWQLPAEQRSLDTSAGLVLAEPIRADRDQPPFDRAMMDGYAVAEHAAGRRLPLAGRVAAGQADSPSLAEGRCVEIMTGAPCPPGTWAVVAKEEIRLDQDGVLFPDRIQPGQNISAAGSDQKRDQLVLRPGDRIDGLATAVLASLGKTSLQVVRPARVAIVTTGAEVVPPDAVPAPAQIRDANGPMLLAMARALGVTPVLEHVTDELAPLADCLGRLAGIDIVVLTGGVSAGRYDFVPDALARQGAEVVFHKVQQKPGKPLLFATRPNQRIFGLPGHPLATHFSFHRYVAPAIRKLQGQRWERPVLTGRLVEPVKRRTDRAAFVLGQAGEHDQAGQLPPIRPMPGRSTADVFRAVAPNCYLEVPTGSEPIPTGAPVRFTRLDPV